MKVTRGQTEESDITIVETAETDVAIIDVIADVDEFEMLKTLSWVFQKAEQHHLGWKRCLSKRHVMLIHF